MAFNFPAEPQTRVSDIFFRTVAGFFGGGFGSLVLIIGVLLSGSFAGSYWAMIEEGSIHPFFVFMTISIIYLALLISALASVTFFYYTDRDRYRYLLSTLTHSFGLITLIFVISTPLSLLLSLQSFDALSIIAIILMAISTIYTVVTMEVIAHHKHLMLTLYSSAIALFTFFLLMLSLYLALQTTSYLLLFALPFCWASFGFWQVSFEMIYQWIYEVYGTDFLNADHRIGSDYIKEQRSSKK